MSASVPGDDIVGAESTDIVGIHHIGHVVPGVDVATSTFRRIGFNVPPFEFPAVPSGVEGELHPFGVGNTHLAFENDFVELVAVADDTNARASGSPYVKLAPLHAPPEAIDRITSSIHATVTRLSEFLRERQPVCILALTATEADQAVARLSRLGVMHEPVQRIRRQVHTTDGDSAVTIGYVEIDSETGRSPEGRIAYAEALPQGVYIDSEGEHPNGARALGGVVLSVPESQLEATLHRYSQYTGRLPQKDASGYTFRLGAHRLWVVVAEHLPDSFARSHQPRVPSFVGYAVQVRSLAATARYLSDHGIGFAASQTGAVLVPPLDALGASVVFQSSQAPELL